MRRLLALLVTGILGLLGCASCSREIPTQPNFVFFLTDDQRWDALSCAGNEILETPRIDEIAAAGIRFTNMFVTTSLCSPSRASILTGKYAMNHGVRRNGMKLVSDQTTFLENLKEQGYETAFIGKWHCSDLGRDRGLDYYFGFRDQGKYVDPEISENYQPDKTFPGHVTDILTDHAIRFIEKKRDRPFCILIWFKSPHAQWEAAERFQDLYQNIQLRRPATYSDTHKGKPQSVKNTDMTFRNSPAAPEYHSYVKNYYRCLAGVDENVGRVLDTLRERELEETTVIVYSSDNGMFLGEHNFFDKRLMYEESIRVPLLVKAPMVNHGAGIRDEMVLNIDIAPTLLDLAGLSIPEDMDGRSLKPLLEGTATHWRDDFLYEYYSYPGTLMVPKHRGVRSRDWKFIHYFEQPEGFELYDLRSDPNEMHNLANIAEFSARFEQMKTRLNQLRQNPK